MNRSKLIEWLLENDCPWDFMVDDNGWVVDTCTLIFSPSTKEENNDNSESSYLATPQRQAAQVQETCTHHTGSKKTN